MNIIRTIAVSALGVGLAALALTNAAGTADAATGGMGNAPSTIQFGTTQEIINLAQFLAPQTKITSDAGKLTFEGSARPITVGTDLLDSAHFESSHLVVVETIELASAANGLSEHDAFFLAGVALKSLNEAHAGPLASDWAAIGAHVAPEDALAIHDGFNSP